MTETEARAWLSTHYPARLDVLDRFARMLRQEAERQNLIARSTFDSIWSRHIVDSAQLVTLDRAGLWLDVGSGGGLPGIVIAALRSDPVILCEPRRGRAEFLTRAADELMLDNVSVLTAKVETISITANVISARAVGAISDLFAWANHAVSRETRYLLPRGRSWRIDLANAARKWHARFHVEHSITDPEAGIVVAEAVRPR